MLVNKEDYFRFLFLDYKILITLFLTLIFMVTFCNAVTVHGTADLRFYSPKNPPLNTSNSDMETLIGQWWNFFMSQPAEIAGKWPPCILGKGEINGSGLSIVFLGNPADASTANTNARQQKCTVRSNDILFFPIYNAACPPPDSPNLLECAIDANKGIIIKKLSVNGKDYSDNIFRLNTSKGFLFEIPKDNYYGLTGNELGQKFAMGEGYYAFLGPLPVGVNTLEVEVLRRPPPEQNAPQENVKMFYNFKVI